MTMALSKELHSKMKEHPEIKWTEIARKTFELKIKELENEDFAWKMQAQRHAVERGWSEAHELFNF